MWEKLQYINPSAKRLNRFPHEFLGCALWMLPGSSSERLAVHFTKTSASTKYFHVKVKSIWWPQLKYIFENNILSLSVSPAQFKTAVQAMLFSSQSIKAAHHRFSHGFNPLLSSVRILPTLTFPYKSVRRLLPPPPHLLWHDHMLIIIICALHIL
jgi:hypothetical protein